VDDRRKSGTIVEVTRLGSAKLGHGRAFAAHAATLTSAALIVALFVAMLTKAQRYFYCATMDRTALSTCCAHERAGEALEVTTHPSASQPCCETRAFRSLAPAVEVRQPTPLSAPLTAVLRVDEPIATAPAAVGVRPFFSARAGPPPPALCRAQLQVYLC